MSNGRQGPLWELWAPPLDPPTEGGLDRALAERIAEADFDCPYTAPALMWDAYAAQQAPEPVVASVSTGVQQVTYAGGSGPSTVARARAEWLRSLCGTVGSVETVTSTSAARLPPDWWQRNLDEPP